MKNNTYLVVTHFADDPTYPEREEEFTCRKKAEERYDEVSWENNAELWKYTVSSNKAHQIY
jgi:hypothetical protein